MNTSSYQFESGTFPHPCRTKDKTVAYNIVMFNCKHSSYSQIINVSYLFYTEAPLNLGLLQMWSGRADLC
jgi:hypothetical protein